MHPMIRRSTPDRDLEQSMTEFRFEDERCLSFRGSDHPLKKKLRCVSPFGVLKSGRPEPVHIDNASTVVARKEDLGTSTDGVALAIGDAFGFRCVLQ